MSIAFSDGPASRFQGVPRHHDLRRVGVRSLRRKSEAVRYLHAAGVFINTANVYTKGTSGASWAKSSERSRPLNGRHHLHRHPVRHQCVGQLAQNWCSRSMPHLRGSVSIGSTCTGACGRFHHSVDELMRALDDVVRAGR
jgi:hypothetical protein